MGKFKQMQIEFDDDYFNQRGEAYTEDEPVEEEQEYEYDSSLEDTNEYPEDKPKVHKGCKHKIKCIMGRYHIATYCEKCGKVFDVKKK